jgi:choline kinase
MMYGIVPVGGKGTRLGLSFSKELFPLKGYDYYYPVCKYTVDNMIEAGCEKIYFIHGKEFKTEILELFYSKNYYHIKNYSDRQSDIFNSFFTNINPEKDDIYLYGLPDSYYEINLFNTIRDIDGLVCGMFKVDDNSKVGRLDTKGKFVKSIKDDNNSDKCWGLLKMNFEVLSKLSSMLVESTDVQLEVEIFLNKFDFKTVDGGKYWDLGTWKIINNYWNNE